MIVTISGPMHCGKTALAKALVRHYHSTYRKPMAAQLRNLLEQYQLKENRENLQTIGHGLRQCDPDVWVNAWIRDNSFLAHGNLAVIDDARYQNEVDLGDINVILKLDSVEQQYSRYETSDKFDPAITHLDWNNSREHATEKQTLVPTAPVVAVVDTTSKSAQQVFEEVHYNIDARIEEPARDRDEWRQGAMNG